MALCASCGTGEDKIKADENGFCGKCHFDNWIEWEDFFIRDYLGAFRGHLSVDYWKALIEITSVKNIFDLMEKVLDSEIDHYSRGEGLTWIFKHKIADGIKEIIKSG